jgi:hypothetical protein
MKWRKRHKVTTVTLNASIIIEKTKEAGIEAAFVEFHGESNICLHVRERTRNDVLRQRRDSGGTNRLGYDDMHACRNCCYPSIIHRITANGRNIGAFSRKI